jgi:hypothetical protein
MSTKTQTKPAARDTGRAVVPSGKGGVSKGGGPSATMLAKMKADQGKGLSKDQADNLVPLIYVLQAQSPQVLKKNSKYIEGAEAGDIWLRNAADPIIKGEEGMVFQPCYFSKDWVEWILRDDGGGYVGRHDTLPDDHKIVDDPKDKNKKHFMSPKGNEYVETRYHVGFVLREGKSPQPFVLPLSSTGHNFSKSLMFFMNSQTTDDGDPVPSFARKYRFYIEPKSNNKGDWFGWAFEDLGWVDEEQYAMGEGLFTAFSKGSKTMEQQERTGDDAERRSM